MLPPQGTLLTLVLVPTLYKMVVRAKERMRRKPAAPQPEEKVLTPAPVTRGAVLRLYGLVPCGRRRVVLALGAKFAIHG
ncbi:hypothetical protein [Nonomuraea sp. 10N515B]|uniref:hypothetical protein n=1 Tax=Nonomuraea sp. 10N515B TaxID=3457422 RepID=UPI003FCE2E35